MEHKAKLYEFGGFDMQWSYYTAAGRKAASCPKCGVRCADWERPPKPRNKKLPHDFNDTYDDKVILSQRAKEMFETHWPGQLKIRQIFDNAWEAEPTRLLVVANQDDVTEYSNNVDSDNAFPCPECGLFYCQTFKGHQFRFANPEIINEDGVFRTDVSFGHAFRSPLWLAGPNAAFAISARFREVYLRSFEDTKDGFWHYQIEKPFRAGPELDAVEPVYPDFLE